MRSSDVDPFDAAEEKLKKATQGVNRAMSRKTRAQHRRDQTYGAAVARAPAELRRRAMNVFKIISVDEKLLERVERLMPGRESDVREAAE